MGKCRAASRGPSLRCPFWSQTFWSWHGASDSLCPSAVLPVAVPRTDFTSQPRIPAPDAWNAVLRVANLPAPKKCSRAETFRKHLTALIAGFFHLRTLFCACLPSKDWLDIFPLPKELPPVQNFSASSTDGHTVVRCPQMYHECCVRDVVCPF